MSTARAVPEFVRIGCLFGLLLLLCPVRAQDLPSGKPSSVTPFIQQMVGTWKVQARMWPGPSAKAVELPPAVARRDIVTGAYLQEVMKPTDGSGQDPFTRVAYFSYNTANQQYEYFSLDSRLPQMMSYVIPGANALRAGTVELTGSSFVAPMWGTEKNVPFMYRLTISQVEGSRQVVRLFLTEQGTQSDEFLAFEYVYSLQP